VSIRAPDGSARYLLDVSEDVTARKLAEDSARLAVVGTLAAGAAHEINNPLTYIQANLSWVGEELQALGADRPPGERARLEESARALAEARQGSERIREIIAGLRVFSRKDEPSLGPTDVTQAVKMALQLTTTQRSNQAPTVTHFSPVAPVLANARQLERVFVNLMVNAAQAIPDGQSSTNQISVTVRPGSAGEVVVEVEDTGEGMTPEVRAHLFEPFFTTKAVGVGTGLGLSICHGTVTSFGGRLEVKSELGRGSTFRVVLPALTASVAPSAPVDATSSALPKGRRVLVVDDDVAVARALGRMLAGGPEVVTSHDAREALAWLERGDPFDLVICDLMMPLLSGEAFQQRLRSVRPELARDMIFVTGGAFTQAASAFLSATKNVCLEKPVRQAELREVVAAKLR
jgi:nitrogen-specific signal transduction histidine kinase/CheY-like chemotaxis protein